MMSSQSSKLPKQPEMKYHPMRRDLWTDPAVNHSDVKLWREYTKNHPLMHTSINVDFISGNKTRPKDITGDMTKYARQIHNDWEGGPKATNKKGAKAKRTSTSPQPVADEEEITIILSSSAGGESKEMRIKPSTPLKTVLSNYAEECGTPLRSLRFSSNGSTLFLSSLGRKTLTDLKIVHLDCISVSNIQEATSSPAPQVETPKKSKPSKNSKKGSGKKQQKKKGKQSKSVANLYDTEEKAKESHSVALSKIFEEAEPIFKAIRQRLNNLTLEKKSPKVRRTSSKNEESPAPAVFNPNTFGLGGKAGKTFYTVNVGQAENLYISSKRNSINSKSSPKQRPTIDLHGCTQNQAVEKLDEALVEWVDTAMKGEYPWVMPVDIICGGGNQILSETVEGWIKSKKNVANAPRGQ